MADEREGLLIGVEVETKEAKKKIKEINDMLKSTASESEKRDKLVAFSMEEPKFSKGHKARSDEERKYLYELKKIQEEAYKLATSPWGTDAKAASPIPKGLIDGFDKTTYKASGEIVGVTTDIEKGVKRVSKAVYDLDEEWHDVSTTVSKAKGSFVESGKMLGDVLLTTKKDGDTFFRTKEIGEDFETVREYVVKASGELYIMVEKTKAVKKEAEKTKTKFEEIKDSTSKLGGVLGLDKALSGLSKFGKRFSSILTYRLVRGTMSAFGNAIKQGFNLLANDNSVIGGIKDTFSSITTSLQVSLTTILIPLFESLASVLEPVSEYLINMANCISYSNAKLNGQSQYFELSKEKIDAYAKSLRESNQQLSQLDKFATLSGDKKADLGDMVGIDTASDEVLANQDKYEKITQFIDDLSEGIKTFFNFLKDVFKFVNEHIDLIIVGLAAVITATNPLLGVFGSVITLLSNASPAAKTLAVAMLGLAGAMLGYGIAKAFALNPIYGAVYGSMGLALGGVILGIAKDMNSGSGASTPSLNTNTSAFSGGGSSGLYDGIAASTKSGYTSASTNSLNGNVYIDGEVVGKVVASSVFREGRRVGYVGGNK